jgi:hypothetical protein
MLARLQAPFEQQRRFAADASHELHPLTAMTVIDVAVERPREAESYRGTLLAVLQRMARLSNDLLQLALRRQPPSPMSRSTRGLLPAMSRRSTAAQARQQTIVHSGRPGRCGCAAARTNPPIPQPAGQPSGYTPQGGIITVVAQRSQLPIRNCDPQSTICNSGERLGHRQGIARAPAAPVRPVLPVSRARRALRGSGLGLRSPGASSRRTAASCWLRATSAAAPSPPSCRAPKADRGTLPSSGVGFVSCALHCSRCQKPPLPLLGEG